MKFNCGPSLYERLEARDKRRQEWHRFFALFPRRVGPNDCRWLEVIERKGYLWSCYGDWWEWKYRPLGRGHE
jgi:hypothetical protein